MVDAAHFRGLRYAPEIAGDPASTSAPAYDALEPFTYTHHRTASPYTVLELLTASRRGGADASAYTAAGAAYRRWRRTGVLRPDPAPAFYRYEQHELRGGVPVVQRGVLAAVAVDPPGQTVLAHEEVEPARVADRCARLEAVPVDLAPVFSLAFDLPAEVTDLLTSPPPSPPVVALTDEAGVDHRVWALRERDAVETVRKGLAGVRVVIADGHHRYAAALRAREHHHGEAWQRTLMHVVDAVGSAPQVLALHRLVSALPQGAGRRLTAEFEIEPTPHELDGLMRRLAAAPGRAFGVVLGTEAAPEAGPRWMVLHARDDAALSARLPAERSARWRRLDAAVLDYAVLPGLGVTDTGGVDHRADLAAACAEAASSRQAALFVLRTVEPATIHALAAEGEPMPPRTTHVRPKPRAGLVMRALED